MNKSGFVRRVILLLTFAWAYARFVLSDAQFIQNEQRREYLCWFLYAAVAWGIVTLLAQRMGKPWAKNNQREEDDDDGK